MASRTAVDDGALAKRILEELVFRRVRATLDLCELGLFEHDLSAAIGEALGADGASPAKRTDLTLRLFELAWDRLSHEVIGKALFAEDAVT